MTTRRLFHRCLVACGTVAAARRLGVGPGIRRAACAKTGSRSRSPWMPTSMATR